MGDSDVRSGLASILAGDLKTEELYRQMGLQPGGNVPKGGSTIVAPASPTNGAKAPAKKDKDKSKKKKGFWGQVGGFFGGKEDEDESTPISGPTNFKREMHIGFNSNTGTFEVALLPPPSTHPLL
jgi:hypothetical protein